MRVVPGEKTVQRYMTRIAEMYEQGADAEEIAGYERRWFGWVRGGLEGVLEEG